MEPRKKCVQSRVQEVRKTKASWAVSAQGEGWAHRYAIHTAGGCQREGFFLGQMQGRGGEAQKSNATAALRWKAVTLRNERHQLEGYNSTPGPESWCNKKKERREVKKRRHCTVEGLQGPAGSRRDPGRAQHRSNGSHFGCKDDIVTRSMKEVRSKD